MILQSRLNRYSMYHRHCPCTLPNVVGTVQPDHFNSNLWLFSNTRQAFPLSNNKVKMDRMGVTSLATFKSSNHSKNLQFSYRCGIVFFIFYLYIQDSPKSFLLAFMTLILGNQGKDSNFAFRNWKYNHRIHCGSTGSTGRHIWWFCYLTSCSGSWAWDVFVFWSLVLIQSLYLTNIWRFGYLSESSYKAPK